MGIGMKDRYLIYGRIYHYWIHRRRIGGDCCFYVEEREEVAEHARVTISDPDIGAGRGIGIAV